MTVSLSTRRIAERNERDLELQILALISRIENIAESIELTEGVIPTAEIAAIRREIVQVNTIYANVLDGELNLYANVLNRTLKNVEIPLEALESLATINNQRYLSLVNKLSIDMQSVVIQSEVLGAATPLDVALSQTVETLTKRAVRNLETEVVTGVRSYRRSSQLLIGESVGIEKYLYFGGLQENSRKFCVERAGKEYTLDELKKMDNGQGLPVLPYLGGYNCQHSLLPVA